MQKNDIILKTENVPKKSRLHKVYSSINNKAFKTHTKIIKPRKSVLNFDKDILISILKKENLKRSPISNYTSKTSKNLTIFKNNKSKYIKTPPNLIKKFRDLPGISKCHNLTNNKINDIIKSSDNLYYYKNNLISKSKRDINSIKNLNKNIKNFLLNSNFNFYKNENKKSAKSYRKNRTNKLSNITLQNYEFIKKSFDSKFFKSNLNEENNMSTSSLNTIKNEHKTDTYLSQDKNEKNKININLSSIKGNKNKKINKNNIKIILNNIRNAKMDPVNKNNENLFTSKWLLSIINSIRNYDRGRRRSSVVDRLVFNIEKPEECFEENLMIKEEKPGDKYLLFKYQLMQHKSKLDGILRDIKLSQIKNEYLMKKYIFELLSAKKKYDSI